MSRSVDLWSGKTDDTPAPPRVRLRVWDRENGKCHACTKKLWLGERWILEHRIALINGGRNSEDNLCLTCCNCLPEKNAADVAEKSAVAKTRKKHLGITKPKYKWPKRDPNWKPRVRQIDKGE